ALKSKHRKMRKEIVERLSYFEKVGRSHPRVLFEELSFCILTPQSKAFSCDEAIRELKEKGLLFGGEAGDIARVLAKKTRFHNNKAKYLVEARGKIGTDGFRRLSTITFSGSEREARLALLKNVKGIGWKEASHYLRNVGRGETVAILDRHILKNLARHGAIADVPKSLTPKKYLEIEAAMEKFCRKAGIPMAHLDLLFWAEETGRIFK
ncbi:MAG: N-glycosylase/DNA lyase, partial [Candidatus Micrarchaeia archaeon]